MQRILALFFLLLMTATVAAPAYFAFAQQERDVKWSSLSEEEEQKDSKELKMGCDDFLVRDMVHVLAWDSTTTAQTISPYTINIHCVFMDVFLPPPEANRFG